MFMYVVRLLLDENRELSQKRVVQSKIFKKSKRKFRRFHTTSFLSTFFLRCSGGPLWAIEKRWHSVCVPFSIQIDFAKLEVGIITNPVGMPP